MKKNLKTLFGKCIYQNSNGEKVYENLLYRWLTFSSPFIQTLISKTKPHIPKLQYIPPFTFAARNNCGKTCLLGLGGGAIVHFLKELNINTTAIEINQTVIEVANEYFFLKKHPDVNIVKDDGANFIKKTQDKYQNLLIDIHDSYNFPKQCLNISFFKSCVKALDEDGVLAINITNNLDREIIYSLLYQIFTTKIISIPINGYANVILLASNKFTTEYMLSNITLNPEVKKVIWDNKFGYVLDYKMC